MYATFHSVQNTDYLCKENNIMRKTFKLQDLDCANCAAKMENALNEIDGIEHASISFMTSKLVIDAADEDFDMILNEAQARISKIEPDCVIVRS